jgi:hypothetical protein
VQEYAASGFPMLLSAAVGARETFLEEGLNGYTFEAGNKTALKEGLKKMMHASDAQLNTMAVSSHNLAQKITPQGWAGTLQDLYTKKP